MRLCVEKLVAAYETHHGDVPSIDHKAISALAIMLITDAAAAAKAAAIGERDLQAEAIATYRISPAMEGHWMTAVNDKCDFGEMAVLAAVWWKSIDIYKLSGAKLRFDQALYL
jgi:hypothetical protein